MARHLLEMLRRRLIARARKTPIRIPTESEAKACVAYAHDILIRTAKQKPQD